MAQEVGGSPLTVGNKVELLIDGPATYASMFAAISAAKDHINMETFLLEPDEIGQSLVAALLIKQHAGVQVNLIYDSVGSLYTPKQFFQQLVDPAPMCWNTTRSTHLRHARTGSLTSATTASCWWWTAG